MKKRLLSAALIVILLVVSLTITVFPAAALSPLPWYDLTIGPFFLVEITSVEDNGTEGFKCYADFLLLHSSLYRSFEIPEYFYIDNDYADEIAAGDMFLIDLVIDSRTPDTFTVARHFDDLEILPVKDEKLVLTGQYTDGTAFMGIQWYLDYKKDDGTRFYDGMNIDEIIVFFEVLAQDREEYRKRLEEMSNEMMGSGSNGSSGFSATSCVNILN